MNGLPLLLLDLGIAGVEVAAHGDRLRYRPVDLPPALADGLRRHKAAILGLLVAGCGPDPAGDPEAAYTLHERLGIADDLGMPTHPGAPAWLIAVGESMGHTCIMQSNGVSC